MKFRKLVSGLYRAARVARDIQVLASGKPGSILKRYANKRIIKNGTSKVRFR